MKNDLNLRVIQSLFNLVATVVFIIFVSVIGKVFSHYYCGSLVEGFVMTSQDVLHGIKIGSYTGGVWGGSCLT
ncbi:hypothetical protein ABEI05_12135 [Erwinia billingiae]|uniref:hypothetical protein n=1 Tax=Erwinia billingiae TaxID=182337 RepID=UPI003208FF0C